MPGVRRLRSTARWEPQSGRLLTGSSDGPSGFLNSSVCAGALVLWARPGEVGAGEHSPGVSGTAEGVRFLKASLPGLGGHAWPAGGDAAVRGSWDAVGQPCANLRFFGSKLERTFLGLPSREWANSGEGAHYLQSTRMLRSASCSAPGIRVPKFWIQRGLCSPPSPCRHKLCGLGQVCTSLSLFPHL